MPSPKNRVFKRIPLSPAVRVKSPSQNVTVRAGPTCPTAFPVQKPVPVASDSPWGDQGTQFFWYKKHEQEKDENTSPRSKRKNLKRKAEDNARELLELKRKREEREKVRFEARELREQEQRAKEAETEGNYLEHEEAFLLKQVPLRSKIRLEQGRAQPVDILARYVTAVNQLDVENIETSSPVELLESVPESSLDDLMEDVNIYKKVHHKQPKCAEFWNKVAHLVSFKCERREENRRWNPKIEVEIDSILRGKTVNQLNQLKGGIAAKLETSGVDVPYWEHLLRTTEAEICRQSLIEEHEKYLKTKLTIFQDQKRRVSATSSSTVLQTSLSPRPEVPQTELRLQVVGSVLVKESFLAPIQEENSDAVVMQDYDVRFFAEHEVPEDAAVVDAEEDAKRLREAREEVRRKDPLFHSSLPEKMDVTSATDGAETSGKQVAKSEIVENKNERFSATSRQEVVSADEVELLGLSDSSDGETDFRVEVAIPSEEMRRLDTKYKPRKPRYFNKIQTGFYWTRYNRTHYDSDNPPPKMVLGYKFNIFYPDLMDKCAVPRYTVTPCADNRDLAVLRFSAGPPYEDVAFQIVNDREWSRSERFGFRNWFKGGVLQLWFRFKKMSYRR